MLNTERLCLGCMTDNGGETVCPICGYDSTVPNPSECLPVKQWLSGRYLIGKVKSADGEGITYAGWDNSSDTPVDIKEYFPSGVAKRNPDKTVLIPNDGKYIFNEGLLEFIDVNRFVLNSDLPSLTDVTDVFEENGTAYSVSRTVSAISLRRFLQKNGGSLKWEQARPLFLPLIDTLSGMNSAGYIHGRISVDTIIVGRDGKLRITGYGIKRLQYFDNELQNELVSGFAAIEQYGIQNTHIDYYTDVYGICAVLFNVLIGTVPPDAADRLQNDSMTIPAKFAEELPRHVLSALANGLLVMPQNRTDNMETFKNELVYAEIEEAKPAAPKASAKSEEVQSAKKKSGSSAKYVIISSACTAAVFLAIVAVLIFTVFRDDIFRKESSSVAGDISSVPSVASIGSVDSGAAESAILFAVPQLTGKLYSELETIEECEKFQIVIKGKEFNDKFPKGQICAQSVQAGTNVQRNTLIEVTVSLGSKEVKIANVVGLDEINAKLELLKQGFLYDNIEVLEKYDEDRNPGTVLEQEPKYGGKVSPDTAVKIYINSYKGDENSDISSTN